MADEKKIENAIIALYNTSGWSAWHLEPDGIWIPKGWPDVVALGTGGRVKIMEVKDPSDPKPDPIQLHFHRLLGSMGHPVSVLTSVEEAERELRRIDGRQRSSRH